MDVNDYIRRKLNVGKDETAPYQGSIESSRETLPEIFAELGYKVGAEIGVRRGEYSRILCVGIPGLKIYCVDPYTPFGRSYNTEAKQARALKLAKSNLEGFNAEFVIKTSEDALLDIADNSLDFVYIDALHDYENVLKDIVGWSKKVMPGGIVSGHDFHYEGIDGVAAAVKDYVRDYNIRQWYLTKDKPVLSYFWVRE
jgi:hypothetical protein